MLYLDFVKNKEDFLLESEEKYPSFFKNFLYDYRKITGQVKSYSFQGKNIVFVSKLNSKTYRKLEKIFKIDVTKNVCVCEYLSQNSEFMDFLNKNNLKIFDGKWLFRHLIEEIGEYICEKKKVAPETQEVCLLINEPEFLAIETIKKVSKKFKSVSIVTNKVKKFEKIEEAIYREEGLVITVTNNFRKACAKSNIIFNYDFDEKNFYKIIFPANITVVNLSENMEVRQSNFRGEMIDFYCIRLPIKYKPIYDKLKNFNGSKLYESFIYKKTSAQNIWNEMEKDDVKILLLEQNNKVVSFTKE